MKRLDSAILGLIAATLCCISIGCKSSSSESSTDGDTLRIAVIPKGTSHEFWKSVHFGAEKAAKEIGNVEI